MHQIIKDISLKVQNDFKHDYNYCIFEPKYISINIIRDMCGTGFIISNRDFLLSFGVDYKNKNYTDIKYFNKRTDESISCHGIVFDDVVKFIESIIIDSLNYYKENMYNKKFYSDEKILW